MNAPRNGLSAPSPFSVGTMVALMCAMIWIPYVLPAQSPMGRITGISTKQFSGIAQVRELASGSLIVADPVDELLYAMRLGEDSVRVIGRPGRGPLEYRTARSILSLPADSTLMPDGSNRRWVLLDGERIVSTIPAEHPAVLAAGSGLHGADRFGGVLSSKQRRDPSRAGRASSDSLVAIRTDRRNGAQSIVTTLRARPTERPTGAAGATLNPLASVAFGVPFEVAEQALLFADGWIAAARVNPYRVDWYGLRGEVMNGAPLPYTPVRITQGEKDAYRRRVEERAGRPVQFPATSKWPSFGSPFDDSALGVTPDGCLVILRQRYAVDTTRRYDVVNRRGQLVGTLSFPLNERFVGSGRTTIYVAVADETGLERLRRHEWNSAGLGCRS